MVSRSGSLGVRFAVWELKRGSRSAEVLVWEVQDGGLRRWDSGVRSLYIKSLLYPFTVTGVTVFG